MKVCAIAAPSHESNAIGSVELECLPQGLNMTYQGVGAFAKGYAPAALTTGTEVFAPWDQVKDVRAHDDHVFIAVDEALTPHHRLWLTNFSDGSRPGQQAQRFEWRRRRFLLRVALLAVMISVAVSLASQLTAWFQDLGQFGALVLGIGGAVVVLLVGWLAEFLFLPRPLSGDAARERFIADLSHYRPTPIRRAPASNAPQKHLDINHLVQAVPRSSFAIVIVLTSTSLAFVLTSAWMLRGPDAAEPQAAASERQLPALPTSEPPPTVVTTTAVTTTAPAVAAATSAAPPAASSPADAPSTEPGAPCTCARSDSALYQVAFPRLSTLLIAQNLRPHNDHHHLDLELGVVNNGGERLPGADLLVHFYEGESKKPTKDRPLHYGARLRPGQAVKWSVDARGDSFLVHNPVKEILDPAAGELASADAFAELLRANHRPVRLHGAMMLAYLDDPRAKGGALKLREALRENEAPYLERVLAALGDMATCDWRVEAAGRVRQVNACVYNRSAARKENLGLQVRALDRVFDHRSPVAPPPLIVAEKTWKLDGSYEPGEGRIVGVRFDTDNPDGKVPKAFEVFADREEVLY